MKERRAPPSPSAPPARPTGAAVIPLRRAKARRRGEDSVPAGPEEGMAALARLLAEAWAC